jgi:hypothetical protein
MSLGATVVDNVVGAAFIVGLFLLLAIPFGRKYVAALSASVMLSAAVAIYLSGVVWGAVPIALVGLAFVAVHIRGLKSRNKRNGEI